MTDPTTWKETASKLYVSFAVPVLAFYALMVPVRVYAHDGHP